MKLKASKKYLLLWHSIWSIPIWGYLVYGMTTNDGVGWIVYWGFVALTLSGGFWSVSGTAANLRVVEMDALGCKISWLWWKQEYLWSDFEIIAKDIWGTDIRSCYSMERRGIIFLKKAKKNKYGRKVEGHEINFSTKCLTEAFYVVFPSDKKYTIKEYICKSNEVMFDKVSLSDPFCVNEAEFMRQLEEWNVPVTETKGYRKWKYTGKIC